VLTEHQKDVLTARHDDIPALYSELSRSRHTYLLVSILVVESSAVHQDLCENIRGSLSMLELATLRPGSRGRTEGTC